MRPTRLLCGVALAGALLTAGCGGDRGPEQFTTAQVAEFFHAVTGDTLQARAGDELDALSIARGDSGRYGSFYVVVMRKPDDEDFYKIENALPLRVDHRGIYWHRDGMSWTAMKRYGNVVLAWNADEQRLDDRFERLHTVLAGLGRPPEQVRAKLGEPTKGSTLAVDRGQSLRLPGLEVRLTRVQTGQVAIPPNDYGLVRRAKGRFVLAAVELTNTGDEPVRGLDDARLQVGELLYAPDGEATFTVTPPRAFPLAPDDSTAAALVFDVPADEAERAAAEGVLAFPAEDRYASIRLADKT
jgi:hypothetical protein